MDPLSSPLVPRSANIYDSTQQDMSDLIDGMMVGTEWEKRLQEQQGRASTATPTTVKEEDSGLRGAAVITTVMNKFRSITGPTSPASPLAPEAKTVLQRLTAKIKAAPVQALGAAAIGREQYEALKMSTAPGHAKPQPFQGATIRASVLEGQTVAQLTEKVTQEQMDNIASNLVNHLYLMADLAKERPLKASDILEIGAAFEQQIMAIKNSPHLDNTQKALLLAAAAEILNNEDVSAALSECKENESWRGFLVESSPIETNVSQAALAAGKPQRTSLTEAKETARNKQEVKMLGLGMIQGRRYDNLQPLHFSGKELEKIGSEVKKYVDANFPEDKRDSMQAKMMEMPGLAKQIAAAWEQAEPWMNDNTRAEMANKFQRNMIARTERVMENGVSVVTIPKYMLALFRLRPAGLLFANLERKNRQKILKESIKAFETAHSEMEKVKARAATTAAEELTRKSVKDDPKLLDQLAQGWALSSEGGLTSLRDKVLELLKEQGKIPNDWTPEKNENFKKSLQNELQQARRLLAIGQSYSIGMAIENLLSKAFEDEAIASARSLLKQTIQATPGLPKFSDKLLDTMAETMFEFRHKTTHNMFFQSNKEDSVIASIIIDAKLRHTEDVVLETGQLEILSGLITSTFNNLKDTPSWQKDHAQEANEQRVGLGKIVETALTGVKQEYFTQRSKEYAELEGIYADKSNLAGYIELAGEVSAAPGREEVAGHVMHVKGEAVSRERADMLEKGPHEFLKEILERELKGLTKAS